MNIRLLPVALVAFVAILLAPAIRAADETTLPPLDAYGGATTITSEASGYFTLREVHGRWYFITPEGHGFIPLGVKHLKSYFGGERGKLRPNEPDLVERHDGGDLQRAADRVEAMLREWGFNYAGYDAPKLFHDRMPFSVGFLQTRTSAVWNEVEYVDVFSPSYARDLDDCVAAVCKPLRGNRRLLGYYLVDLPLWGDRAFMDAEEKRQGKSWLSFFRGLPDEAFGKRAYEAFLAKRYAGRFGAFKKLYATSAPDFGVSLRIGFGKTDRYAPQVVADDEAFIVEIADQVYRLTNEAFRRHDPNHLVLGERFTGERLFWPVIEKAAKYFPVVAVQLGGSFQKDLYGEIYRRVRRPTISVDHVVSFTTPQTPNVRGGRPLKSEAEAAALYGRYLREAFAEPFMVGYNRCQLVTRIRIEGDPPVFKQGLLDPQGHPYSVLVEAVRAANREVLGQLYRP